MRVLTGKLLLVAGALVGMAGCASIGPPEAPSLELPKPPTDLRAARKGDKVTLTWTIPARTTDRQRTRYLGKTLICRSTAGALKQCGTPTGEAAPPADFEQTAKKPSGKKLSATFTDTLPVAVEQEHPTEFATYAVEVLNQAERGAGLSNQTRVPLVPTLAPFRDFAAQATAPGVLIRGSVRRRRVESRIFNTCSGFTNVRNRTQAKAHEDRGRGGEGVRAGHGRRQDPHFFP